MTPLQAVVLDGDGPMRAHLVARLRDESVHAIVETDDVHAAVRGAGAADLLLCGLPIGLADCQDLLHQIAASKSPPAVAFLGAGVDIYQIETLCLTLGLRYLGLLSLPVSPARLQGMIRQLQAFRTLEPRS